MSTPAAVAIVFPFVLDPDKGGVQRITWTLGEMLARRGWNVLYVSCAHSSQHRSPASGGLIQPDAPLCDGEAVRSYLERAFDSMPGALAINQIALDAPISKALWQMRKVGKVRAVVNCFHANPAAFRDNVAHLLGHRFRNGWVRRALAWPLVVAAVLALHRRRNAPRFRRAVEQCDRLMLLSPTFFDELRWYVPDLGDDRLIAIPNGFPAPDAQAAPSARRNTLLYVGRIENGQKNVLMIPRLWARLAPLLPDWDYHIVGDGPDLAALQAEIARCGLARIVLHGWQAPSPFYRQARIFTMLSAYEGFGNTLIEAQSHGTVPVVFDSYSAARWILNDGKDAALVAPFDEDAYIEAVVALARDSARLDAMSAAACANVARFSQETMGETWHRLLSTLGNTTIEPGK